MFVPLHDDTPLRIIRFQIVTGAILALNVLIFLYTHHSGGVQGEFRLAFMYGVIPVELLGGTPVSGFGGPGEPATLLTYMFLHAGWLHIISNMLFLWVFADNVEDWYGHLGFLAFYLCCGVAAGLTHVLMVPDSNAPLIGASGAVAGVMAAYLVLFPRARLWVLVLMKLPLRVPAWWALVAWFGLQVFSLVVMPVGDEVQVAWWAHIGGFLTGLCLTMLTRSLFIRPAAG